MLAKCSKTAKHWMDLSTAPLKTSWLRQMKKVVKLKNKKVSLDDFNKMMEEDAKK